MNRLLKTGALAVIVSLVCMFVLSCSDSGTATVSINLNLPKNAAVIKSIPDTIIDRVLCLFSSAAYAATPPGVTKIAIVVTGPGLSPFEGKYPADTEKVVLAVEAGKDRTFLIKAYDSGGTVIYAGSSTVDLKNGETKDLVITMRVPLRMVQDINNSVTLAGSNPNEMTPFKGKLYFRADDGTYGSELWVYDPITGDCHRTYDINNGSGDSYPNNLLVFNNKLYFAADDGINGNELWEYDGTSNPAMVYNIYPGSGSSDPRGLTIFNNKLYFSAFDGNTTGTHGTELWEYDGKAVPAVYGVNIILYDVDTIDGSGSNPTLFTPYDGKLFFNASTAATGSEVFYLEGNSVVPLYDIYPLSTGSDPYNFKVFKGNMYFSANGYYEDERYKTQYQGYELWRYDGVNDPTLLSDINRQPGGTGETLSSSPEYLSIMGDNLYFSANDGENGRELWMYNGVFPADRDIEVTRLSDIRSGAGFGSNPQGLCAIDGLLYFSATDDLNNSYLYSFDPSSFAITPIVELQNDLASMAKLGNAIVYCDTNNDGTSDVWIYNPAKPVVMDINPYKLNIYQGSANPDSEILLIQGNRVFISADDGINYGQELWVYVYYE